MTSPAVLRLVRAAALGALCLAAQPALACSISTQGVAFGGYDPFSPQALESAGTIAVNCELPYSITLSSGGGSYAGRVMRSDRDNLVYNLYLDPARTLVWGDGSGGSGTVSGAGGHGVTNHPLYGRIPARQNVAAGSYQDTLIMTVNF